MLFSAFLLNQLNKPNQLNKLYQQSFLFPII